MEDKLYGSGEPSDEYSRRWGGSNGGDKKRDFG
jgi:hypothetical protein